MAGRSFEGGRPASWADDYVEAAAEAARAAAIAAGERYQEALAALGARDLRLRGKGRGAEPPARMAVRDMAGVADLDGGGGRPWAPGPIGPQCYDGLCRYSLYNTDVWQNTQKMVKKCVVHILTKWSHQSLTEF